MSASSEGKKRKIDDSRCVICNILFRKSQIRRKIISNCDELQKVHKMCGNKNIKLNDAICHLCIIKLNNVKIDSHGSKESESMHNNNSASASSSQCTVTSSPSISSQTDSSTADPSFHLTTKVSVPAREIINLPISRVISTHNYCFLCGYLKRTNIVSVPHEARLQAFIKIRLYIPQGNRCCKNHLINKRFYEDEFSNMKIFSTESTMELAEVTVLINRISIDVDKTLLDKMSDFNISEERLQIFTGLSWENIILLREQLTSMRNSDSRSVTQAIIIFLFKLRSGESNKAISAIFEIEREQQVSDMKNSVLKSFVKDVLPKYFGLKNAKREDLIQNQTSNMAKKLHGFENELVLICDGTYIRHQKSSNNEYQRKSFSGQKKVPLCKPFTVCTTNGFVVDMVGPFLANKNDAEILRTILVESEDLKSLLEEGDVFILDRGFRDIIKTLEDKGFSVLMPALKGKNLQLSTEDSNNSRFITKLRWVVEAIHGILKKKFKLLDRKLDNKLLPEVGEYCRIACYLNNLFGKRLDSDEDTCDEIVKEMKSRRSIENTLAAEVEQKKWNRRKVPFKQLSSADLLDFPELTEKDLKILFTGSYQLRQTVSYLAEMMDENNKLNLAYCHECPSIIKLEVQSRHVNRNVYKCYIQYRPKAIGHSSILRYCCSCANGNRTVGCCAHTAAM